MDTKKSIFTKPIVLAVLALFSCFLWGSAFPIIKLGYKFFSINKEDTYYKIIFAGIRFTISGTVVFLLCLIRKVKFKITKDQLKSIIYLGILQTFIQYIFFYIGMSFVSGTNGSIISSLSTFISVIMAHFFFKADRLNLQKSIGVLLGLLGVIILNLKDMGNFQFTICGEGFIVVSTITSALAGVYIKKVSEKTIDPFLISGGQLMTGGLLLLLVGLIGSKGQVFDFNIKGILILFYMAFISAAAFSTWAVLLKYNRVSKVIIYRSTIPLFGVLLSVLVLCEKSINYYVGVSVLFVTVGIILINSENLFKKKKIKNIEKDIENTEKDTKNTEKDIENI